MLVRGLERELNAQVSQRNYQQQQWNSHVTRSYNTVSSQRQQAQSNATITRLLNEMRRPIILPTQ